MKTNFVGCCKREVAILLILLLGVVARVNGGGAYNIHYNPTPGEPDRFDSDAVTLTCHDLNAVYTVYLDGHWQGTASHDTPFGFTEGYNQGAPANDGLVRTYTAVNNANPSPSPGSTPIPPAYQEDFVSGQCIGCFEPHFDGGPAIVTSRTVYLDDPQTPPPPPPITKCTDLKLGGTEQTCSSCSNPPTDSAGMAQYSIHAMLVSLNIQDIPLRYSPPRGPAIDFTVTYNERESQQLPIFSYSNLGPKWTFGWLSYVTEIPNTPLSLVSVYVPGGGAEIYQYDSNSQSFLPDPQSHAQLFRLTNLA